LSGLSVGLTPIWVIVEKVPSLSVATNVDVISEGALVICTPRLSVVVTKTVL
jgi:hypothetical protein